MSYNNPETEKIKNLFLPASSILKYRPAVTGNTSKNETPHNQLSIFTARKRKLYNQVYKMLPIQNTKKRYIRRKVRHTKLDSRTRIYIRSALKRRILRVYKLSASARKAQLTKVKKLR